MAIWPRDIYPNGSSYFSMPGAARSRGLTGKHQRRATMQSGRRFVETYPIFKADSPEGRAFIATINDYWRNGTQFTLLHHFYRTHNGGGTGAPEINAANQTGKSLITNGWTGANPVLKAGDIIRIAGISRVFDVLVDAPNLVAGGTTLSINPPLFSGGSPANGALITYTGVLINAYIAEEPSLPQTGPNEFIAGLRIAFEEAV